MTLLGSLTCTLVSAALYGFSFAPARVRPLAWIALVPFLVAVRRVRLGRAVALGWVWTVAAAYAVGDWFPRAVATYYEQPAAVGIAFFLAVSSFMAGLHYMAFAACYRALGRRPGATLPLLAAAGWVAAEFGRVSLLSGNPWALFGYSQAGLAALVQVADVTGVYGVTFTLVAVNAGLAEVWLARRVPAPGRRRALRGLGLAAGVVLVVLVYGAVRLRTAAAPFAGAAPVPVTVVQGNLDLGSQWREEFYGRNLDAYLRLTRDALTNGHPALVVWPESAFTFFLADEPAYRRAIGRLLEPYGLQLLAGGPRTVAGDPVRYHNTAFLVAPTGEILSWYDKERLLPFAEYFPIVRIDFLRRRFARVRTFSAGGPTPPLPTVAGPAGIVICNEAMFGPIASARVRAGASYLVNLANDSWLGDRKFSEINLDIVSLRAVEQRRYLVRASTSGPSAIVDPLGQVVTRTAPFTQGTITGSVRPGGPRTVYCRLGDAFALLALTAVAAALLGRALRAVQERGAQAGGGP
jgi:apolipoprotein N-acyltransferase